MRILFLALLILSACFPSFVVSSSANPPLRWAMSGGGWRAMSAAMGFAQAFSKSTFLSEVSAISTVSGSSWFSLQYAYSDEFHQRVNHGNLTEVVVDWMDAYRKYTQEIQEEHFICSLLGKKKRSVCNVFLSIDGSWANFINGMLQAASTAYGDADLTTRVVNADNRVAELEHTDMFIQMSLAANSKSSTSGKVSYLRPQSSSVQNEVYTVPISVQHAVMSDDSTHFAYAIEPENLPLQTSLVDSAPRSFSFDSWKDFYLNNEPQAHAQASLLAALKQEATANGPLTEPFFGKPTVAQLAASSSAAGGFLGAVPSLYAQVVSSLMGEIVDSDSSFLSKEAQKIQLHIEIELAYRRPLFEKFSVCTQWPMPCEESDGRFVDGGYVDETGLAQNVGHHHRSNFDKKETLKLMVTFLNSNEASLDPILAYWSTEWNANVPPGDFCWPPSTGTSGVNPRRSTQIFADSMDTESYKSAFLPIEGTALTYATFHTTTVNNPAFGVQEGQPVELLVIQVNSDIPTTIVGVDAIDQWTGPLAEMAREIAESEHLITVVEDFLSS